MTDTTKIPSTGSITEKPAGGLKKWIVPALLIGGGLLFLEIYHSEKLNAQPKPTDSREPEPVQPASDYHPSARALIT